MPNATDIVYEFDTEYGHYQVIDMVYDGRPARVLFSGNQRAAQSGQALDDKPDLLFDYNQRLYELVVGLQPKRLLIIGGGMFTLPMAILADLPEVRIDVVELDSGLLPIAKEHFKLRDDPRLTIYDDDGLHFLMVTTKRYDMILLDAYTHDSAEPTLASPAAIARMAGALTEDGVVGANIIAAYFGRRSQAVRQLLDDYSHHFAAAELYPASQSLSLWLPQNLILVAGRNPQINLDDHLRYRRLEPTAVPFNLGRDLRL